MAATLALGEGPPGCGVWQGLDPTGMPVTITAKRLTQTPVHTTTCPSGGSNH